MPPTTPTHLLSDVDPFAITICKQGANGQRIFLKKSADAPDVVLPHETMILKATEEDWTVFYCVVAEPGTTENGGIGAETLADQWASEDEIRKAAHRFARNKGYVNAMHDAFAEQGCTVVENAVALGDMTLDGDVTLKKGSWYVAIEPSPEFREKVDSGEITGVSLEGTGVRTAVQKDGGPKLPIPNAPGKSNWVQQAGGFPDYMKRVIEHILGSRPELAATPEGVSKAIQLGVGIVQNWAEGHDGHGNKVSADTQAKASAAVAEWNRKRGQSKVQKTIMERIAEKVGLTKEDVAALDTDPTASLDFTDDEKQAIEAMPFEGGTLKADEAPDPNAEDTVADKDTQDQLDALKKSTEDTNSAIGSLTTLVTDLVGKITEATKTPPTVDDVKKQLDEQLDSLASLKKSVDALAEGGSSQDDDDDDAAAEKLRKAREKNPLAGLLD